MAHFLTSGGKKKETKLGNRVAKFGLTWKSVTGPSHSSEKFLVHFSQNISNTELFPLHAFGLRESASPRENF